MSTKNFFLFVSMLLTVSIFAQVEIEIESKKTILVYCIEKLQQEFKQYNKEVPKSFYELIQQASSDDFLNENIIEQVMQDLNRLIEDPAIQSSAFYEQLKSLEQSFKEIIIEQPGFEADAGSSKKAVKQYCNLFVRSLLKVCGTLAVNGEVFINPLTRAGNPIFTVNGDADVNGTLTADNFFVSGTTQLGDIVFDDATITGNLTVNGSTALNSTLSVAGNSTLASLSAGGTTVNSLSVTNNATIGGTLNVTGNTTVNNLAVNGTFTVPSLGNTTINGTLNVTGATTLQSTLGVSGTSTLGTVNAGATSATTLSTSGLATLNSASVTTTLGVTGVSTFNSTVNMTPSTAVDALNITPNSGAVDGIQINNPTNAGAGGLAIRINNAVPTTVFSVDHTTGNTSITGTLGVTGATSLSTISASGAATLNSLGVTNNATVGGTLGVTGTTTLGTLNAGASTLTSLGVTNNATVGGTLGVTGTTTLGVLNAGATSATTLSTSGLATLNSASVTTTLGVTGVSTFNSTVNMTPSTAVDALNITPNSGAVDGIQINNPTNAGAGGLAIRINNAVPTTVFSVDHTTGNTSITGTLGVTGATSLSTISASGAATLNSLGVTNNATVGGTLGVTGTTTLGVLNAGATSATTLSTSGLATLNSASVTTTLGVTGDSTFNSIVNMTPSTAVDALNITPNSGTVDGIQINNPTNAGAGGVALRISNAALVPVFTINHTTGDTIISGTLNVGGSTALSTLSTSGLATLNSLNVTTSATVGTTLGVTGDATLSANLNMSNTSSSSVGVINKGGSRFLHNFGTNNLFLGVNSGNFTTSGSGSNLCIGTNSGSALTTGNANTFIGSNSGAAVANATANTFVGFNSGLSTTGSNNTVVGYLAGQGLTTGGENIIMGRSAGVNLGTGTSNVIIGYFSGDVLANATGNTFVGQQAGGAITSGDGNVFIGNLAGSAVTSGGNNVILGTTGPAGAVNNQCYLGNQTQTALYLLSNAGAGTGVPGSGAATQNLQIDSATGAVTRFTSSARYKDNIKPLDNTQLDVLSSVRPVSYNPKNNPNIIAYGLIAEEVDLVDKTFVAYNDQNLPEAVHYSYFIPLLIQAYQQQKKEIEELKQMVAMLLAKQ